MRIASLLSSTPLKTTMRKMFKVMKMKMETGRMMKKMMKRNELMILG